MNLNLPYKPLESTLSRADLSIEWSAEKPSHADIIIHQHYHPPHHHRHHYHHQHPHHYHHLIILINGNSRRSIIIISTIFIIITSTSSPLSFLSSKSLQNHFHHHRRRRYRYYNCLEQKHVEKEVEYMPYSVGYHCYFISQSTKALQLKKRARFWYAKNYFIVKTIYWLQWLRHSICILINKLHLQLLNFLKSRTRIPSKHCTF